MIESRVASKIVLNNVKRLPSMRAAVRGALGHVLAKDIKAPFDQPPFNRSAMDGYAIARGDEGSEFEVVGEVLAGDDYRQRIRCGTAVKIMTGAKIPTGTGKVLMKEHVELIAKNRIRIAMADDRKNIRIKGESIKKGKGLFSSGQFVTPTVLANIASTGIGSICVYRKPSVGVIITGNELQKPGNKLRAGKIYDSNGPLIHSLLALHGFDVGMELSARDDRRVLTRSLRRLLNKCDAVFVSGGISVGDYDLVYETMRRLGAKVLVKGVAIQPGKPFTFAVCGGKPIFAFPGNPVSIFVTYLLFAMPALYKMMGAEFCYAKTLKSLSGEFKRKRVGREMYVPVTFVGDDRIKPLEYHGSGDLYALGKADGFMIIPAGKTEIKDGEKIETMRINDFR
jgi:molybdopterin molybdotransferase